MLLFVASHAGRATLAMLLALLLVFWPPSVNFLAAAFAVAYAITHFRESFRALDAAFADLRPEEADAAAGGRAA